MLLCGARQERCEKDLDEAVSLSLAFSLAPNFVFFKLIFAPPLLCFALSWLALTLTFALSLCRCPVLHFFESIGLFDVLRCALRLRKLS